MGDMFEGIFMDTLPESVQIKLSRKATKEMKRMGIRSICIIDYDENYGPYLRFYTSKKSTIFKWISENPAFLSDILILSGDTKEMLLRDERSLIIFGLLDKKGMKLMIIETTKEFRDEAAEFLDSICEILKNRNLSTEVVTKVIEEELMRCRR